MATIYKRVFDGDSSATIDVCYYNENETTLEDLIDLSTLRKAVGPTYSCRVTRIFYSVKNLPLQAADVPVLTDHFTGLYWNSGSPTPDIMVVFPEGVGTITETFQPTTGLVNGNPGIYVQPYTVVTLHVTLEKIEGFPLSLNKPKLRRF